MLSSGEKQAVDMAQNHEHHENLPGVARSKSNDSSGDTDGKDAVAVDIAQAHLIAAQWTEGTEEEKKLLRKLDWRILPCTWVLYFLGYLDRANIGYVASLQLGQFLTNGAQEMQRPVACRRR